MRAILAERNFPVDEIRYFASARSAGTTLPWKGERDHRRGRGDRRSDRARHRPVLRRRARRRASSRRGSPRPASSSSTTRRRGGWIRTCRWSSARSTADEIANARKGIIANPNCTTMAAMPVLKPLHDEAGLVRLDRQHLPGGQRRRARRCRRARQAGARGRRSRPRAHLRRRARWRCRRRRSSPSRSRSTCCRSPASYVDDGSFETDEEQKLRNESRKILAIPDLRGQRHVRAGAGVHRPLAQHQRRVRPADQRRACHRGARAPRRASS